MRMSLKLNSDTSAGFCPPQYDEELDDVRSVISDVCEFIADYRCGQFMVSGCGNESWPVDERTDLAVLLEQLPDAIDAVRSGCSSFVIDFYEQGLERTVIFNRVNSSYDVFCRNNSGSQLFVAPDSVTETNVLEMFLRLQNVFLEFVERVIPSLSNHPWLTDWKR